MRHAPPRALRRMTALLGPVAMLALVIALLAQQHGLILQTATADPPPWRVSTPAGAVQVGVTTGPLARDSWRAWNGGDLATVNAFEHAAHAHADIVMWYADWRVALSLGQLRAVAARHSIPEITWEPWNASDRQGANQPHYALRRIIAGDFDRYIRSWARGLAAYGKPVRLRFAQEMNGNWYPWDERANGNHFGQFIEMWRHVHQIFTLAGARNVTWVWSPVNGDAAHYFPGLTFVNAIGVTCLNGGTSALSRHWRSFAGICAKPISQLHHIAPQLPIEISETGSGSRGGDKAAWITHMFAFLKQHPVVRAMIWFDMRKETDWSIQTSPASERAFARGLADARAGGLLPGVQPRRATRSR
jgi:hypothetical protein